MQENIIPSFESMEEDIEKPICYFWSRQLTNPDLSVAFSPSLLSTMSGVVVPENTHKYTIKANATPFVMPVHLWKASVYIENDKLQRREGHATFISQYIPDGDKFSFTLGNFTQPNNYCMKDFLESLDAGELMSFASASATGRRGGAQPKFRMKLHCSHPGCPVVLNYSLNKVLQVQSSCVASSDNNDTTSSMKSGTTCYAVSWDCQLIKGGEEHIHCKDKKGANRPNLPYDPFNPIVSLFSNGTFRNEPGKVDQRCDFRLLPPDKLPSHVQLRQSTENTRQSSTQARPTLTYENQLLQNLNTHGAEAFNQTKDNLTIGQAKGVCFC